MGHFTSEELHPLVCEMRMVGKHLDPCRSQSIFIDQKEKKVGSDVSFFQLNAYMLQTLSSVGRQNKRKAETVDEAILLKPQQ